ncbi:MAG: tetratricopeptide repeat protein [Coriobacteriales bacterium]|nr:tetratricopeptide repeat protein [Coriobacteriales bacterium]
MKSVHYEKATVAYNSKDYPQALKGYYQCLKEDWGAFEPGDAGLVYHRIGNCLIKMRSYKEAAVSYQKALQDDQYLEKASIYVNLGTTLNGIGKYQEAISYFNKALTDASYATPYRAHMGLGAAYAKLEKHVEAGTAYRDAALDDANPNPVKALMSLGSSFTLLGRPSDAVEAYLAILDFRVTGKVLNTTLELLGRAHVASGHYQEGLEVFEDALTREQFSLSPQAQDDYQKARLALGLALNDAPAAPTDFAATPDAWDKDEQASLAGFELQDPYAYDAATPYAAQEHNEGDGYGGGNVPDSGDTGFFTATDADLIEESKRELRKERKLRNTGLRALVVIVVILIVLLGACVVAYTQGIGIPSQETVTRDFFTAHAAGDPVEDYWVADSEADKATLKRLLDGVAKSADVTIVSIDAQMTESEVVVDAKLPQGGTSHYRLQLSRDIIGWKISGIEMIFASS